MSRPEYGMDPQSRRECGTATGYNRHYRAGERACRPCLDAHAAAKRAQRAARSNCRTCELWLGCGGAFCRTQVERITR